jgi:putative ABC transport system ATP-binding protein
MIETRGLQHRYPNGTTVTMPDISAPQGHTLLLQGPSGSGKSTLLALCCGLLEATQGSITVAGQALSQLTGAARDVWRGRTLGFLPQRLFLSEFLSVRDNLGLAYFACNQPRDEAHIERTLHALGVGELADRRPSELSGGQAQRVALARASLLSPQVLLADEPTASLDDAAAHQAITLLVQTAQRSQATLVIATHDARIEPVLRGLASSSLSKNISKIGLGPIQNARRQL